MLRTAVTLAEPLAAAWAPLPAQLCKEVVWDRKEVFLSALAEALAQLHC